MSRQIVGVFKNRVRKAREDEGLNQTELASKLGVKVSMVSHMETGRRMPSLQVLLALGRVLNKPIGFFLEEGAGGATISPSVQRLVRVASTLNNRDIETVIGLAENLAKRK
jgi:transcriptional regulator with XRE-family HTH domain